MSVEVFLNHVKDTRGDDCKELINNIIKKNFCNLTINDIMFFYDCYKEIFRITA